MEINSKIQVPNLKLLPNNYFEMLDYLSFWSFRFISLFGNWKFERKR